MNSTTHEHENINPERYPMQRLNPNHQIIEGDDGEPDEPHQKQHQSGFGDFPPTMPNRGKSRTKQMHETHTSVNEIPTAPDAENSPNRMHKQNGASSKLSNATKSTRFEQSEEYHQSLFRDSNSVLVLKSGPSQHSHHLQQSQSAHRPKESFQSKSQQSYKKHPQHHQYSLREQQQQYQQHELEQRNSQSTQPKQPTTNSNSLNFSMIATPGGAKLARIVRNHIDDEEESSAPSSGLWPGGGTPFTPFSSILRGVVSSTPGIRPRQLLGNTPYTAARHSIQHTPDIYHNDVSGYNNGNEVNECTAWMFARSAPLSGYLRKLGKNIPTFKRRFFVLKPSTHLYYFLSPSDCEPRGCIDLDLMRDSNDNSGRGSEVREIGVFPDGTFRFELLFDEESLEEDDASDAGSKSSKSSSQTASKKTFHRQSIILEARTEEMGREWISKLQSERLSSARDEIDVLKSALAEVQANLSQVRANCDHWEKRAKENGRKRMETERERDLAQNERDACKKRFQDLNGAIGLLLDHASFPTVKRIKNYGTKDGNDATEAKEKKKDTFSEAFEEAITGLDITNTHFSGVTNLFQNIHDELSNASLCIKDANEAIQQLEQRAVEAENRLSKSEVELGNIWQDNCTFQRELKKVQREKKILVKEVRALRETRDVHGANSNEARAARTVASAQDASSKSEVNSHQNRRSFASVNEQGSCRECGSDTASLSSKRQDRRVLNEEERRLVIELEEHVMSGLRLSEQFLTLNGIEPSEVDDESCKQASFLSVGKTPERKSAFPALRTPEKSRSGDCVMAPTVKTKNKFDSGIVGSARGPMSSLLDSPSDPLVDLMENARNDASAMADSDSDCSLSIGPRNNSVIGAKHVEKNDNASDMASEHQNSSSFQDYGRSKESVRLRSNNAPKNEQNIDNKALEESGTELRNEQDLRTALQSKNSPYDGCVVLSSDLASSTIETFNSRITDNGCATTKLECSLRDVGESPSASRQISTVGGDGRVYHITFYSSKIGLQFQKVPAETKSSGILTDAMTTDHGPNVEVNPTAAELRRIASISQEYRGQSHKKGQSIGCLPVAPVDAVLVCGFVGFDDSAGNNRPQIGARLVAFDGIPVEVGRWTFESIRKSIQARGRPLTLSFRNDFLTPTQRAILTKAVNDVNALAPPPPPPPPQTIPSHNPRGETEPQREKNSDYSGNDHEITSVSSGSTLSSQQMQPKYYSFSEAGASNVFSSAVAPLMSNFVASLSSGNSRPDVYTPDYLRRQSDVKREREHHEFKSSLL